MRLVNGTLDSRQLIAAGSWIKQKLLRDRRERNPRQLSLSKLLVVIEVLKSVLLHEFVALSRLHVFLHHFRDQFVE